MGILAAIVAGLNILTEVAPLLHQVGQNHQTFMPQPYQETPSSLVDPQIKQGWIDAAVAAVTLIHLYRNRTRGVPPPAVLSPPAVAILDSSAPATPTVAAEGVQSFTLGRR